MFNVSKKSFSWILFPLMFITIISSGQVPTANSELKNGAMEEFQSGNYSKAYELFASLLEFYPKDGLFNYYAGICLYKTDKDLNDAIDRLEYASTGSEVPYDVFYHLGQAYKKNYQFKESKAAFQKHLDGAGRGEIRDLQSDLEISYASYSEEFTMEYNPFEILASSLFSFSDSIYTKQVRGKGGILSSKPDMLLSKNEKKGELTSFMFLPKKPQKGDYLYFSGYSRTRKKDSDLFRVRINGRKKIGTIEKLEELNSEYDEILPYFDPVGNDLYFASRGHNSMGGFDVFKSHYDEDRKKWNKPVNLGFPINSPENEYIAMPGQDLGTILLATDRQGLDSMLTVYKLILQEPKKSLTNADNEELKKIGNLGGISAIPSIVDLRDNLSQQELKNQTDDYRHSEVYKENRVQTINDPDELNISLALSFQKKSDSLSILAKKKRIEVRSMPNPDDRWAWQRQIIDWEKKANDYSEKANNTFALLESNRSKVSVPVRNIPESIEKDKEINGITVYKFREIDVKSKPEKKETRIDNAAQSKANIEGTSQNTFETKDEPGEVIQAPSETPDLDRFLILGKSPYNSTNPFPQDVDIPDGAFFRIQLGVFSKNISYDAFGGISPITAESIPEKSLTRFYAGKFSHYKDARDALTKLKEKGFNDAFIVSWYNGEKVSVNKVIELEKRDAYK